MDKRTCYQMKIVELLWLAITGRQKNRMKHQYVIPTEVCQYWLKQNTIRTRDKTSHKSCECVNCSRPHPTKRITLIICFLSRTKSRVVIFVALGHEAIREISPLIPAINVSKINYGSVWKHGSLVTTMNEIYYKGMCVASRCLKWKINMVR